MFGSNPQKEIVFKELVWVMLLSLLNYGIKMIWKVLAEFEH